MPTQTRLNESIEQPALLDFLRSLQAAQQTRDQIRADAANRKREEDDVSRRVQDTLAHLPKLDEICNIYISQVLDLCNGNRIRTARILGIGRTSLYRYLRNGYSHTEARLAIRP